MTPDDYAPPAAPTLDQQRDALRKGLGRAAQWAATGRLADDALLAACLTDQRYDQQVDEARGDWLFGMVRAVGAEVRFRVPILHALYELSDERSVDQLCGLARHYAAAGDDAFRTRLYEIVEQKPVADRPWLGETELLALDEEAGFLFAAGVRGRCLADDGSRWDDEDLIYAASSRFGDGRVRELLARSPDVGVRRFRDGWLGEQARRAATPAGPSQRKQAQALSVEEVLRRAAGSVNWRIGLRRWGAGASPPDLAAVLDHLWAAREPAVVANLLTVFTNRALPEFDARLIDLCRHPDDDVRQRAYHALEQNMHPLIRPFALERLAAEPDAVGLFIRNYEAGDELRILSDLTLPEDDDIRHGVLMDVVKVLEENPQANGSRLGLVAYAGTPCAYCRGHAAEVLRDRGIAPGWLRDECRRDADEICRGVFAEPL